MIKILRKIMNHLSATAVSIRPAATNASVGPGPQALSIGQTTPRMPIRRITDGMLSLSADTPEQRGAAPAPARDNVKVYHIGKDRMPSLAESRDITPTKAPGQPKPKLTDPEARDQNGVFLGPASATDKAQASPKLAVDRTMRISPLYYSGNHAEITMAHEPDPVIGLQTTKADFPRNGDIKPDLVGEQIQRRDQPVYSEDDEDDDMWVEAFKVGTHRDSEGVEHKWEPKHLDIIAQQYNARVDPKNPDHKQAPVVLGHPKDDSPAYGWVDKVRVKGDKLMAHLDQLNTDFVKALKAGAYKFRSISLYPDLNIRHLGFLGGVQPAVPGLGPYKFADNGTQAKTFEFASPVAEPDDLEVKMLRREISFFERLFSRFKLDVDTNHSEPGPQDRVPITRETTGAITQKEISMAGPEKIITGPVGPGEKTVQVTAQPKEPEAQEGILAKMRAGFSEAFASFKAAVDKGEFTEDQVSALKKHFDETEGALTAVQTKLSSYEESEKALKDLQAKHDAAQKAHEDLAKQHEELQKKHEALVKTHEALASSHTESTDAAKDKQFCEGMVAEGRVMPGLVEGHLKQMALCRATDSKAANFAETHATPEVDNYKQWMRAHPVQFSFGEHATTATAKPEFDPTADASKLVSDFCEAEIKANPKMDYSAAFAKVAREHPAEVQAYMTQIVIK